MRPDQMERLKDLGEKLIEVIIVECDPDHWPGAGKPPKELTAQERGDGVWVRKQAAASLSVLQKVQWLVEDPENRTADPSEDNDRVIAQAEAEANRLLKKIGDQQLGTRS